MSETTIDLPSPVMLSLIEQRILGVLIEKQKTTPDVYPMTINGLVTGCNQKSNRDPILNLNAEQIEETLENLNNRGLIVRVVSGRADKWKHVLYEHWKLDKVEIAALADLFLRGPQTEGELRTHVGRMEEVPDLESLRSILRRLTDRKFTVYLTPEGRRGTVVTHGCQDDASLERLRAQFNDGSRLDDVSPPRSVSPSSPSGSSATSHSTEIEEMRKQLAELRLTVERISQQMQELTQQSGTAPASE